MQHQKKIDGMLQEMGMETARESPFPMDTSSDYSTTEGDLVGDSFPHRTVIGSVPYLATHTRPDMCLSVSVLARHVEKPTTVHGSGARKLLRYLRGTKELGLKLCLGSGDQLSAHVDANWGGEPGSGRRSRSGIAVFYGNALIYFSSTLQSA